MRFKLFAQRRIGYSLYKIDSLCVCIISIVRTGQSSWKTYISYASSSVAEMEIIIFIPPVRYQKYPHSHMAVCTPPSSTITQRVAVSARRVVAPNSSMMVNWINIYLKIYLFIHWKDKKMEFISRRYFFPILFMRGSFI